jgi:hypothetical protein
MDLFAPRRQRQEALGVFHRALAVTEPGVVCEQRGQCVLCTLSPPLPFAHQPQLIFSAAVQG